MASDEERAAKAQRRRDKRWEKMKDGPNTMGLSAMGPLVEIFSPGTKHVAEEQQREKLVRTVDGDDLLLDIDWKTGKATLRPRPKDAK